jgi:hypothetical protein
MKISPQDITLEALKAGKFNKAFPLLATLKRTVENNSAHDQQSVLDHTLGVLAALNKNFSLEFVKDEKVRKKLQAYLGEKTEISSRQTLIFLATVFHDVGKAQTLIEISPGVMACPGHELISKGIAREYLKEIELTIIEKSWILQFILLHGYVHGLLAVRLGRKDRKFFDAFHDAAGDLTAGLLLFVHADNLGSDLQKLNPEDFAQRTQAIQDMIGWWYEAL